MDGTNSRHFLESPFKREPFKRTRLYFRPAAQAQQLQEQTQNISKEPVHTTASGEFPPEFNVLVINSSTEMAREITSQLSLDLPGSGILFAPTLELAKWILRRRQIDLIVSGEFLPDEGVAKLNPVLEKLRNPPNLVVVGVGGRQLRARSLIGSSSYKLSKYRCLLSGREGKVLPPVLSSHIRDNCSPKLDQDISTLGNDIRNDLNNPLQEIVALVFVVQSGKAASVVTNQALDAIEKAAKNMATVVNGIEAKIRDVVSTR